MQTSLYIHICMMYIDGVCIHIVFATHSRPQTLNEGDGGGCRGAQSAMRCRNCTTVEASTVAAQGRSTRLSGVRPAAECNRGAIAGTGRAWGKGVQWGGGSQTRQRARTARSLTPTQVAGGGAPPLRSSHDHSTTRPTTHTQRNNAGHEGSIQPGGATHRPKSVW